MTATSQQIRSRETLIAAMAQGLTAEFLFFWGHRPKKDGSLGQSCFSQWYPASFEVADSTYLTAEHFMMAEKARLFSDPETLAKILATDSPSVAKKLGREVNNYDDEAWKARRFDAVVEGNLAKFTQNEEMGSFLLATENSILVEASPYDRIWGIGLSRDHAHAAEPAKWRGQNLLGFALMEVRQQLQNDK